MFIYISSLPDFFDQIHYTDYYPLLFKWYMWNCTNTELHPYFKECIKSFNMHKTFFFKLFIPLVDIMGIKPAPGDLASNFKKVSAIPCCCNTK